MSLAICDSHIMSTVSADDVWGKRACRAGDPPGAQFCFYLLPNSPVPQSSSSQGIKAVSTSGTNIKVLVVTSSTICVMRVDLSI